MGRSMSYENYIRIQTKVHGQIKKPHKYRVGERAAINYFFYNVQKDKCILDVGCGVGTGIKHLRDTGYKNVMGIDLSTDKTAFGTRRGDVNIVAADIAKWKTDKKFDVFWVSHSFEHVYEPEKAIGNMIRMSNPNAQFFFILPYPDTGVASAHCASADLGLYVEDDGASVVEWFENGGLTLIEKKFDDFREQEIWLRFIND